MDRVLKSTQKRESSGLEDRSGTGMYRVRFTSRRCIHLTGIRSLGELKWLTMRKERKSGNKRSAKRIKKMKKSKNSTQDEGSLYKRIKIQRTINMQIRSRS